jgi:hypothetical protein
VEWCRIYSFTSWAHEKWRGSFQYKVSELMDTLCPSLISFQVKDLLLRRSSVTLIGNCTVSLLCCWRQRSIYLQWWGHFHFIFVVHENEALCRNYVLFCSLLVVFTTRNLGLSGQWVWRSCSALWLRESLTVGRNIQGWAGTQTSNHQNAVLFKQYLSVNFPFR